MAHEALPVRPRERFFGLTQVFPESGDVEATKAKEIDIIVLHGLAAESPKTWIAWKEDGVKPKDESEEVNWLSHPDMLPKFMPTARVLTYDWNANYDTTASTDLFLGHADTLLRRLHINRRDASKQETPLIFIASCFGGLLLAKALNRACHSFYNSEEENKTLLRHIIGLVFLGTPFRGSWQTGSIIAEMRFAAAEEKGFQPSNQLLNYLKLSTTKKPSPLDELVIRFGEIVAWKDFEIPIFCCYETEPTEFKALLAHVPDGYNTGEVNEKGAGIVVDQNSAKIHPGVDSAGLNRRHNMLHKFYSPTSEGFPDIMDRLQKFVSLADQTLLANENMLAMDLKVCSNNTLKDRSQQASFPDMNSRFEDLEQPHSTSTAWLSETDEFKTWSSTYSSDDEDVPILTLEGKAGSGKSVLLKRLVSDAHSRDLRKTNICLSYFFDARKDKTLQNSAGGLYRCLLSQLLGQLVPSQGLANAMAKWSLGEEGLSPSACRNKILTCLSFAGERIVSIYIDALDELSLTEEGSDDDVAVLAFLGGLVSTKAKIRFCISVRDSNHYGDHLKPTQCIRVDKNNGHDIALFVEESLGFSLRPQLRRKLVDKILERASNIFLWVKLVIRDVNKDTKSDHSDEQLMKRIDKLHSKLEDLYSSFLQGMDLAKDTALDEEENARRHEAMALLRLVQVAMRPLTIAEVRSAFQKRNSVAVSREPNKPVSEDEYANKLQDLCKGLVELRTVHIRDYHAGMTFEEDTSEGYSRTKLVVQLTHYSVKEFLEKHELAATETIERSDGVSQAHMHAAQLCMQLIDRREDSAPFWQYSMQFWTTHARKGDAALDGNLVQCTFVKGCGFRTKSLIKEFKNCVELHDPHNYQGTRQDIVNTRMIRKEEDSLLPILAFEGCTSLIRIHEGSCKRGAKCCKDVETLEAAFFLATQRGWEDSVKEIHAVAVRQGVVLDVDKPYAAIPNFQTPLSAACALRRHGLIVSLLKLGCHASASPVYALHGVVRDGDEKSLGAFLEYAREQRSTDQMLALRDPGGFTVWHYTAAAANWELFNMLLNAVENELPEDELRGLLSLEGHKGITAHQLAKEGLEHVSKRPELGEQVTSDYEKILEVFRDLSATEDHS